MCLNDVHNDEVDFEMLQPTNHTADVFRSIYSRGECCKEQNFLCGLFKAKTKNELISQNVCNSTIQYNG